MEVDLPPEKATPTVRPGSKRTHTGELAITHSPQSPSTHSTVQSIVSTVFNIAFSVSARALIRLWYSTLGNGCCSNRMRPALVALSSTPDCLSWLQG